MSAVFVGVGVAALATVAVWAFVSLVEDAYADADNAERRDDLDDYAAEWDQHVEDAPRVTEPTPVFEAVCFERWEAEW